MPSEVTKIADLINPQVMGDMPESNPHREKVYHHHMEI